MGPCGPFYKGTWAVYMMKKQLFANFASLLLILNTTAVGYAAPNESGGGEEKQIFVTTEPIQTEKGKAHVEVISFQINSLEDLKTTQNEILKVINQNKKTESFFRLDVMAGKSGNQKLIIAGQALGNVIECGFVVGD